MQSAITLKAIVQPGGKIEINDDQLLPGHTVDVIVLLPENRIMGSHSIIQVLKDSPGHLLFQTVEDVDAAVREERDDWEN